MAAASPELRRDAPLAPLTTIRVGGRADAMCTAASFAGVVAALRWAAGEGLPVAVIGRGSNLIVADEGFRGLVLRLAGRLAGISVRGDGLWCGGGASLPRAVQRAAAHGLEGLEWGAIIPGTVGGAVAMNAGAHAGELAGVLRWAVLCSPAGRRRVGPRELELGYRRSAVGPGEVVAAAGFGLRRGDPAAIAGRLAEFRAHRRATQPQGVRTFGSVFTNPPGDSAGRLLEAAGCKGLAVGRARFSEVHANFIEAAPGCRAADVLALMAEGRRRVLQAGGPRLEPEVRYLDPQRGIVRAPPGGRVSARAPRRPRTRARRPPHPAVAARRREIARARGRRRRAVLLWVLAVAAAVAVGFYLATGPLLAPRGVSVSGYDRQDRPALVAALTRAAANGTVILPAIGDVEAAARRFPWVEGAQVSRDWPLGMAVRIIPARPAAVATFGDRSVLVSASGRILGPLEPAPNVGWLRLEVAPPPAGGQIPDGARAALEFLTAADPAIAARVRDLRTDPDGRIVGRLKNGPQVRLGDGSRMHAKALALRLVLDRLDARQLSSAAYIDVSAPERPAFRAAGLASIPG